MKAYCSVLVFIFFLLIGIISCQREEIMSYDSEETGVNIFFDYAYTSSKSNIVDSTYFTFGYDKLRKDDSIYSVPVRIVGYLTDYDREIKYTIVDSLSTGKVGVNYDIVSSVLPADSMKGVLKIRIYNTADLNDTTYKVCIRLLPNENFTTDFDRFEYSDWGEGMDPREFYIKFDNEASMPNLWAYTDPVSTYNLRDMYFKYGFGEYSNVKHNFILYVLGVDADFFTYDPAIQTPFQRLNEIAPYGGGAAIATARTYFFSWGAMVNNALDDYERENGKPLLDENGEPVTMGHNNR